jgi:hypothetical protein
MPRPYNVVHTGAGLRNAIRCDPNVEDLKALAELELLSLQRIKEVLFSGGYS